MPKTQKLLIELAKNKKKFKNDKASCLELRVEIADMCTSEHKFEKGLLARRLDNSYGILEKESENQAELDEVAKAVKVAFGYDSFSISYTKAPETGKILYHFHYEPPVNKTKLKNLEVQK